MADLDWIAVDWGTSNQRAWLLGTEGEVLSRHRSDRGMNAIGRDGFEPALLDLVGDRLPQTGKIAVIICGMAGSRQGWAEAPYRSVPCAPPGLADATMSDDGRSTARRAHPARHQAAAPRRRHAWRGNADRGHLLRAAGFRWGHLPARDTHEVGAGQRGRGGELSHVHDGRDLLAPRRPVRSCGTLSARAAGTMRRFAMRWPKECRIRRRWLRRCSRCVPLRSWRICHRRRHGRAFPER